MDTLTRSIIFLALLFLAGCDTPAPQPHAGAVTYTRAATAPDGSTDTISVTYETPEAAADPSSVTFPMVGPWWEQRPPEPQQIAAGFGSHHVPSIEPEPRDKAGERWLYGAGIACVLGSGVFFWRTHVKLGAIAIVLGFILIGLGATVHRFAEMYAYGIGGCAILAAVFFGVGFWRDYVGREQVGEAPA